MGSAKNVKTPWLGSVLAILGALFLTACGGDSGGPSLPAAPTDLTYSAAPTFTVGKAITPLTPTVTGTVTAFAVAPALPDGLSLSTSTGAVSGTPTAVAAMAQYTVTASNAGGSTTARIALAVALAAPSISYGGSSFTLTVGVSAQALTPKNSGGAVATWSISPALPAGLTLSAATGDISGTPSALAAPATYIVTAQNSGGQGTASLTLGVQSVLLDLGHVQQINLLRLTSTRVMSLDSTNSWILWDYATATKVTGGLAACRSPACVAGTPSQVDLESATLVDETAAGLEIRSSSNGTVLAVIATPVAWWKLATDGSYVCAGSTTALTVWSTSGAVIATVPGNFSTAVAFAAPGQVQIARGPAGANVIQTVTLPSGTLSVTPAFQGTFNSWFLDGQHFLTNTANTVWTYTTAGVQADITATTTVENLTGQGNWFWTNNPGTNQLSIYKVGASGTPTATINPGIDASVIGSGLTIGVQAYGAGTGTVIDLSGPNLVSMNFTAPIANTAAYAAISSSQWVIGNVWGVVLDGASIAATPRYFGYGAAWSIAGSSPLMAIATASGSILYFNAATYAKVGAINYSSSQLALSSDGTVLAAAGDQLDVQYHSDWSVNTYSLPSGTEINNWPYSYPPTAQGGGVPFQITLSASGTALGQVVDTVNSIGLTTCSRQVTAVTGGPVLWSDTVPISDVNISCAVIPPIRLSPDGTQVAVSDDKSPTSATNIYSNGVLVTAVTGWVVGWLSDTDLLANSYTPVTDNIKYSGSTVYNSSGTKIATPPLPELQSFQIVSTDSVYDPGSNAIYSTATGLATWTSASPSTGVGAVAGSNVVFASGSNVVVQPY